MNDQREDTLKSSEDFFDKDSFKSCFARSVAVNLEIKNDPGDLSDKKPAENCLENQNSATLDQVETKAFDGVQVRYRKNNRSASMDDSRRYSCGSIVARRTSLFSRKLTEVPIENIYSENKLDTLLWQLKEVEKNRDMYKALTKQVVTFLEKAYVSLEKLGHRLNVKNSVPRSKSDHHIVPDLNNSTGSCRKQTQKLLVEEHLNSWFKLKYFSGVPIRSKTHPPKKSPGKTLPRSLPSPQNRQISLKHPSPHLSLLRTINYQLRSSSDIEFLAQLAKEFPRNGDGAKPQRTTSFSLSPKLILPENDVKISTAFNRKLSLQACDAKRISELYKSRKIDFEKGMEQCGDKAGSPGSGSVGSLEDESGFSSLNSFQEIGVPLVNSTAFEEVSARSVFLKKMLHNQTSDFNSLTSCDSSYYNSEATITSTPQSERRFDKTRHQKPRDDDLKLWNKYHSSNSEQPQSLDSSSFANSGVNKSSIKASDLDRGSPSKSFSRDLNDRKRWSSTPDKTSTDPSLKVLWV